MFYIGIDPGVDGAIAVSCGGGALEIYGFKDFKSPIEALGETRVDSAPFALCLEHPGYLNSPGSGKLLESYGLIAGFVAASKTIIDSFEILPAQTWRRQFFRIMGETSTATTYAQRKTEIWGLVKKQYPQTPKYAADAVALAVLAKHKQAA